MRPMKRVYLLRPAKSSWRVSGVPDHDRPLAHRERRAATAIARHLREQGIEPELVLCSTARRARETLERIEPALGTPGVRFEPELYGASAGGLLDRLHGVPEAVGSVMLIGHNPALRERSGTGPLRLGAGGRRLNSSLPGSHSRAWDSYRLWCGEGNDGPARRRQAAGAVLEANRLRDCCVAEEPSGIEAHKETAVVRA